MYKKLLATLLAATMILSAGCGKTEQTQGSESKESTPVEKESESVATEVSENEPIEIEKVTLYPQSASLQSGVREGYMKDLFAKYGLEVEVWAFSDDKTNAILASGDLPDVMYVKADQLQTLIEGEMVLNLEDYLDQIPNLEKVEGIEGALNYSRQFLSAGTGKLYGIPIYVGTLPNTGTTDRSQLMLYWDYYEGLGCPEFDNPDDLIEIFKDMKEKYPKDALGNETYAAVTYYRADQINFLKGYSCMFGYVDTYFTKMVAANMATGELEYLLEEDGILREGVTWLNKLYREGLLDPNSINVDRASLLAKTWDGAPTGTYFSVLAEVSGSNDYFKPIYFPGEMVWNRGANQFGGNGAYLVVNANTKNVDAALRLLNMFADADAYLEWLAGPEGEIWEVKEGTNEAYLTDKFVKYLESGASEEFTFSTGEQRVLFNTLPIVTQGSATSYTDADGNPRTTFPWQWSEALLITNNAERQAAWREHYGYENWFALLEDKDALITTSRLMEADKFITQPSDDQKLTISAITDKVVNLSWKMIYAQSDAEFEGYWEQMVKEAEGLGAKEIYDWAVADIENAVKIKDSLIGK